MQKSSKIICLGIVVSLLTFVMPMGLRPFVFLAGPIIIAYGIYSKGPEFREFNRKSYLAMMIGIFLFVLSFLIMWLLGSMMSTPYVPSIFALLILAAICLIIYGISSRKRQPSGEGWEAELEKSGRAGSFKEKNFVVPYTPEDSYAAMNETAKKLAYGKVFEKDDESKSLLFGVQQTLWHVT